MAILGAATFDPGSIISLQPSKGATRGQLFCSERGDLFEASIPLIWENAGHRSIIRTGYRQLHRSLWNVSYTEACEHIPPAEQSMQLPPGATAITDITNERASNPTYVNIVCLSAHNVAAQWRFVIGLGGFPLLLRKQDCCFLCAFDQAVGREGKCYVIL